MSSHNLDRPPVAEEEHNFKYYCKPDNFARIIQNRKAIFGTYGLVCYLGTFFLIIIGLNLYCDKERFNSCRRGEKGWEDGEVKNSDVYNDSLKLIISYHLIEWVRIIMFLVTIILGQNMMKIWYITSLNTIFGIIAYIYVHAQRFSDDGKACVEEQPARAQFLIAEVCIFWLIFHIASFPQFFLFVMKKQYIEDALKK